MRKIDGHDIKRIEAFLASLKHNGLQIKYRKTQLFLLTTEDHHSSEEFGDLDQAEEWIEVYEHGYRIGVEHGIKLH